MSDACVTDSFARAKEAWSGSIRSPYPDGAQAAGRIHPLKVCVTTAAVVNPGCALTGFNAEEAGDRPRRMRSEPEVALQATVSTSSKKGAARPVRRSIKTNILS